MSKVWGERFAVVPDSVLQAKISINARFLWTVLARYADPGGQCYPGLRALAEILGVSEDTVRRAKKELAEAKLLECHQRFDEQGRRTSDHLILHRGPSTGATYLGGTGARGSSTSIELENTLRENRKNEGPAFECPICPTGTPDPTCPVCEGQGTFRMEAV